MFPPKLVRVPIGGEVRNAQRLDVRLKASLRETGSGKFSVDVLDMSVTGCRLETSFTLAIGSRVWITIPGLAPVEAIVAWKEQYRYGCRFASALHMAVLDHIVARCRKAA
jgi:PilZ domain